MSAAARRRSTERWAALGMGLLLAGCGAAGAARDYHVISGQVPLDWRGPDGNSVVLDAPDGLIVVDTGRHPEHAAAIVDYAQRRGRPIAAIVNTHWHLDHTTGNHDIRSAYPKAEVYATTAIEGALGGYLGRNRAQSDKMLADPAIPAGQKAQILRGRSRIDNPDRLRPTRAVARSGRMTIAGRTIEVNVAPYAATEADIWLYDRRARLAIVGDLVVDVVPFMDTACPDGWAKALEAIAATDFVTLIPGHGPPMTRAAFTQWTTAYTALIACGRSDVASEQCVAGWQRDAGELIPPSHRDYAAELAEYYVATRLRSSPEEQRRYCPPQDNSEESAT